MDDIDDVQEEQDLTRDVSLLVAIAKLEAAIHEHANELERIPPRITALDRKIAELDAAEKKAVDEFESTKKERRTLEQGLQDAEAQVIKYKGQLMSVKTNKEYTAMLKEIEQKEAEIEQKEERLLELMDEMEDGEEKHEALVSKIADERSRMLADKKSLEDRRAFLQSDTEKLSTQKPKLLSEVDPAIQKRYQRVLAAHSDLAVTRTENEHCGGCGTQLPPQVVVEVKKNKQLITCQSCGRILVDYS